MLIETKYCCAKCGGTFHGQPKIIGAADVRVYPDGAVVPDIGLCACEKCYLAIKGKKD